MKHSLALIFLLIITLFFSSCESNKKDLTVKVLPVNPTHFIKESLVKGIEKVEHKISNREKVECYKVVVKSIPHEHQMGPWCPNHVNDSKEMGGIWFDKGKVYDVDGHFIANIAAFYEDEKWQLYNADGSIKVTQSQAACEGAAKPNVEEIYKNHCVECQPSFYQNHLTTYYIPVHPIYTNKSSRPGRGGVWGMAFNGVNFDPPAPTEAILAAHTLAPLDDCGGHVNPHTGYHYHAATNCTKEIVQPDEHGPMIGYAIDGFGIYAQYDKRQKEPTDLDACRGHEDSIRGYHYHAGAAGGNQIIACLNGAFGEMVVSH